MARYPDVLSIVRILLKYIQGSNANYVDIYREMLSSPFFYSQLIKDDAASLGNNREMTQSRLVGRALGELLQCRVHARNGDVGEAAGKHRDQGGCGMAIPVVSNLYRRDANASLSS